MLSVMCPNCRHRFPAPGCCNLVGQEQEQRQRQIRPPNSSHCFYGGVLVPRGYTSGGGCFINAPTIVHGPAIIQTSDLKSQLETTLLNGAGGQCREGRALEASSTSHHQRNFACRVSPECHITTTCDLTGGSVTITTPSIQAGGCLIQTSDSAIVVQSPHIEIRPKLSGGGCFLQKLSTEAQESESVDTSLLMDEEDSFGNLIESCCDAHPPSGCQELPGIRRSDDLVCRSSNARFVDCLQENLANEDSFCSGNCKMAADRDCDKRSQCRDQKHHSFAGRKSCCCSCRCCGCGCDCGCCRSNKTPPRSRQALRSCEATMKSSPGAMEDLPDATKDNSAETSLIESTSNLQIAVNATVQLPASLGQCTLSITASTNGNAHAALPREERRDFNTKTLLNGCEEKEEEEEEEVVVEEEEEEEEQDEEEEEAVSSNSCMTSSVGNSYENMIANERRDGTPSTPVSWLMSSNCPWGFDAFLMDRDTSKLSEIKRLLQTCGWYHEGISWQQSENLLKNVAVGRWLMRDSSDSRYTFAVSVQTERGPTSVRVLYQMGRFRLDAEPKLALNMPLFDCPIKMLEYYVNYSKKIDEKRKEVWVDYSGELYSQIYLTKPLLKQVRSLSHLARLAVNRNNLPTDHLPPLIKNYIAEYPYTL
ncbi:uncharacterized protein [Prorops nasuta]|uniref:uncharacterized protein n=1 Tax=Prorops nasuta TaxID=863751 RepID=UPI0034CE84F1